MTISTRIIGGYTVVFFIFLLVVSGAIFALNLQHKQYGQFIDTRAALADGASDLRIAVSSQLQHYHGMFLFSDLQQHYIRELEQDSQLFSGALEKMQGAVSKREFAELNEIGAMQSELERDVQTAIGLVQRGKTAEAIGNHQAGQCTEYGRYQTGRNRRTEHARDWCATEAAG